MSIIDDQSIQSRITLITASCKNPIEHSVGQSVADRLSVRLQADREIKLCHRHEQCSCLCHNDCL